MPRQANGNWVNADGSPIYVTDPKDSRYASKPGYKYVDGRWIDKNGQPLPENGDMPSCGRVGRRVDVPQEGRASGATRSRHM